MTSRTANPTALEARVLRAIIVSALLATTFVATAGRVTAQGQERPVENKPLFVAIVDEFPDVDAKVILIREPGRDIILLDPEQATPENLSFAMTVRVRVSENPLAPGTGQMLPITGGAFPYGFNPERKRRLEEIIERVLDRPTTRIGTFGYGRWMRYQPPEGEGGAG